MKLALKIIRKARALGPVGMLEVMRAARRGQPRARIGRGTRINGPGRLAMAPKSSIGEGAKIYIGPGATLTLGEGARLSDRAVVNATVGVELGARARVSWDVQILDSDFHSVTRTDGTISVPDQPVLIAESAFVGANAMILKGVTVGEGAVVGAGSVVAKSVAPRTIVVGNPARVVGRGSRSDLMPDGGTPPTT